MFCAENFQMIVECFVLSIVSFTPALTSTIPTVQRMAVDEAGGDFDEDEDLLRLDIFRFSTSKRYPWDDWTIPTKDYSDYDGRNSSGDFILYVFFPVLGGALLFFLIYLAIRAAGRKDCFSSESDSHSSRPANPFAQVHPPPRRGIDLFAELHGPAERSSLFDELGLRTEYGDARRELLGGPARTVAPSGQGSNRGSVYGARMANYSSTGSTRGRTELDQATTEKPPDYSTVALSDLISPANPTFPAVKKDDETPPPAYGKENPLFK